VGELIPFNVPFVPEISRQYVLEALESNHQQGDGPFTAKASNMLSDLVGGGHVLLTPSCTHALEMASMLANIGRGDEVILPSYTFTSAATAVAKFGAIPVFVDIEMETKGIDVNQVREAITPKTKAISWVNYAGVAPDIDGLQSLAKEFDLLLIEDNAHGLGGSYKGKPLGSFGDFATQSFHATKNIQCGEGGALIINNPSYVERAEIIREKGTDRSKFIRGEVQKYQWIDQGSSYLLAEVLAALLAGQLECFTEIQAKRVEIWKYYYDNLPNVLLSQGFLFDSLPTQEQSVAHIFYIVSKKSEQIRAEFSSQGLTCNFHYQSLRGSSFVEKNYKNVRSATVSDTISKNLLRFPIYPTIALDVVDRVFQNITSRH
jgi:dTDP-4-amino-4,6-dideoxygalactose transaminase